MVVDAEKRMKEIEHLNEVTGPVFKIKNDPESLRSAAFFARPASTNCRNCSTY